MTYGIGECGVCGSVLRQAVKRLTRKGAKTVTVSNPGGRVVTEHPLYVCDATGCVGRSQMRVDAFVDQVVVGRGKRPDAADLVAADDTAVAAAREKASAVRARLETAADEYAEGYITAEQLRRITAKLRPDAEAAEDEARRASGPRFGMVEELLGPQVEARWRDLSVTRKRAVLEVLGVRVRILPTRKGAGFDPDSVDIEWRPTT